MPSWILEHTFALEFYQLLVMHNVETESKFCLETIDQFFACGKRPFSFSSLSLHLLKQLSDCCMVIMGLFQMIRVRFTLHEVNDMLLVICALTIGGYI